MLGNPKYMLGEEVAFNIMSSGGADCVYIGSIAIVDRYGTFEDNSDVSYDILVKDTPDGNGILFKHVNEKSVLYSISKYKS